MGIRISIGAIIAVLLGGTGYLAQQSHSTKNLLQKREVELSAEKDNSAKLNIRFKTIEQQMKGLQSRLDKEGTSAKTEIQEMSRLIVEKSASLEQEKSKVQNLEITLKQIQTARDDERKMRAEAEKANKQNTGLAANRAEEIQRLETQAQKMSQLVAEKSAGIKQEKTEIRNLKSTLDIINSSLNNERRMRAEAEKANIQNTKLAANRAEETKRLEKVRALLQAQVVKMRKLIAEKTADIEQEKAKTQNLESALQEIQVALETERKTRVEIEKSHKRNLELARNRAEEMKRLEKAREIIEAQVRKMDQLIATEKEKVEKRNIADKRKSPAKAKKSNAQDAMLAKNRAEEMKRLEQTREILNTQVQEISRLIAEKNTDIEQEKTKAQNLKLTLEQIQKTLVSERKARTKVEESNVQNAELARKRVEEINQLQKARELLKAQVQEMSQLIAEKTSVAELIKNKLDQTNLSLSETIKKHTLAIARSKILEKKAQEEAKRSQKLASDLNEMNSRLKKQSITLERTKDLLRVTFVNNYLFDLGSAEIKEKGIEALSKVAEFLQKQKDKMIRIEGHTDNQPIKGNLLSRYPTNWELSVARAVSVVKYLESKNIAPKRLSATGHSFYRPVASNDTVEGRAKNRRTDILLSNPPPNTAAATP